METLKELYDTSDCIIAIVLHKSGSHNRNFSVQLQWTSAEYYLNFGTFSLVGLL